MDELIKDLRKIYVEKLTKSYPLERVLIFLVYLLGRCLLSVNRREAFVEFVFSFQIDRFKKILPIITIGDCLIAFFLVILTVKIYWFIKRLTFMHLSRYKGFSDNIARWKQETEQVISSKAEHNKILVSDTRKRIDSKKKGVINLHLIGEVLLSLSIVILISFTTFNSKDCVAFLLCLLAIVLIQRGAYLIYLKDILPQIVIEKTFTQKDFSHQEVFTDEFTENNDVNN